MPTLYIDHSIVTHEASWKPLGDILQSGKLQLGDAVVSLVRELSLIKIDQL
jgi:hypothetical protein